MLVPYAYIVVKVHIILHNLKLKSYSREPMVRNHDRTHVIFYILHALNSITHKRSDNRNTLDDSRKRSFNRCKYNYSLMVNKYVYVKKKKYRHKNVQGDIFDRR